MGYYLKMDRPVQTREGGQGGRVREERIPFRRSIQLQFALTYLILIAAILLLLNTYPVLVSQDLVFRSKASMLHSQASVIANTIAQTEKLSAETVRGYIEPLDYMSQYRVLVTDQFGRILYDSDDLRATEGRYAMLNEVVAALKGYDVATSVYREDAFHSRAAVPVLYRDITIGCVYLYEHDTEQARLLTDIQQNLRSISLVVCVAALLMSIIFSQGPDPAHRRAPAGPSAGSGRGEYSHRVDIRGRDELSQLAGEFNQLTGRIQTTEESGGALSRRLPRAQDPPGLHPAAHRLHPPDRGHGPGYRPGVVRRHRRGGRPPHPHLGKAPHPYPHGQRRSGGGGPRGGGRRAGEGGAYAYAPGPGRAASRWRPSWSRAVWCWPPKTTSTQIAFNLMENAVKYNVPNGRVTVTLRGVGDLVLLTVEDTGVGIPEEDLAQGLRPLLPGGQGPLPGRRRHRPGPVHRQGYRPPARRRRHGRRREGGGTCFRWPSPAGTRKEVRDHAPAADRAAVRPRPALRLRRRDLRRGGGGLYRLLYRPL